MINLLAFYSGILEVLVNYSSTFQQSFQLALFFFSFFKMNISTCFIVWSV